MIELEIKSIYKEHLLRIRFHSIIDNDLLAEISRTPSPGLFNLIFFISKSSPP